MVTSTDTGVSFVSLSGYLWELTPWLPGRGDYLLATVKHTGALAVGESYARAIPEAQLLVEDPGHSPLAWQGGQLSRAIDALAAKHRSQPAGPRGSWASCMRSASTCSCTSRASTPARLPARRAVIQTIAAKANVDLPLAGAAVLLAIALIFGHVALHAAILSLSDSCHGPTVAPVRGSGKFRW